MGKLTPELRKVLKLQYPEDIILEIRGEITHFKDTEENWRKLGKGLGLEVFKEPIGNRNWVLYNPKNFEVSNYLNCFTYLQCISEENLKVPINCSSCEFMFYNFKFHNKDALKNFDTSDVKVMPGMFYNCSFPNEFSLGDKFDTRNAESIDCMFSQCKFPNKFTLGDKFDTSNIINTNGMFRDCILPEGKTEKDFNNDPNKVVEWLKSRNLKYLDKISNTDFFN